MNIVITDLTEMGAGTGKYCVAGWDVEEKRMIRLLPNGSNWREAWIARYTVFPGHFGQPRPLGIATGSYPHRTEDAPIDPTSLTPFVELSSDWLDQVRPRPRRTSFRRSTATCGGTVNGTGSSVDCTSGPDRNAVRWSASGCRVATSNSMGQTG